MFCTNCGKRIPASTVRCPSCGQEQDRLEGGNGFWDMVDGPRRNLTPEPPPEPQKKNSKWPVWFSVFCMLLCVICIASVLILKMSVDNALNEISSEIDSMNSSFTTLEALIGKLEGSADEQETEIASIQSIIENYETKALTGETLEEMPEAVSDSIPEEPLEAVPGAVPEESPEEAPGDVPEDSPEEASGEMREQPVEITVTEETEADG